MTTPADRIVAHNARLHSVQTDSLCSLCYREENRRAYQPRTPTPLTIGPTQKHILLVLSTRGPTTVSDWGAWYPLTQDQAGNAIRRLGKRGLVDAVRMEGNARVYGLTQKGLALVKELSGESEDDG